MFRWPDRPAAPRIVALVGQREATGMPQHVRMGLEAQPGLDRQRAPPCLAKPAVVNGEPRSDVNTNGDLGSCSRCSWRSARSSSPTIGWVARGAPLDPADVQSGGVKSI